MVPRRIACLHVPCKSVHVGVKTLLIHSGCAHPQALAYAVTVAGASHHRVCSGVAADLLKAMRYHPERLVKQAELMVRELGRVDFSPARPVARGTGNKHRLCVDEQSRECTHFVNCRRRALPAHELPQHRADASSLQIQPEAGDVGRSVPFGVTILVWALGGAHQTPIGSRAPRAVRAALVGLRASPSGDGG